MATIVWFAGCSQGSRLAHSLAPSHIGAVESDAGPNAGHLHVGLVRAVLPIERRVLVARTPGVELPKTGSIIIRDHKHGTTWYGMLLETRSEHFLIAAGEPPYPPLWQDVWFLHPD